jgi:hypothetical protein
MKHSSLLIASLLIALPTKLIKPQQDRKSVVERLPKAFHTVIE